VSAACRRSDEHPKPASRVPKSSRITTRLEAGASISLSMRFTSLPDAHGRSLQSRATATFAASAPFLTKGAPTRHHPFAFKVVIVAGDARGPEISGDPSDSLQWKQILGAYGH
jgi:hypothetical protein